MWAVFGTVIAILLHHTGLFEFYTNLCERILGFPPRFKTGLFGFPL